MNQLADVVQSAIERSTAHYGTEASISVDIAARSRNGSDVKTVRVVREDAVKFKIADFEVE